MNQTPWFIFWLSACSFGAACCPPGTRTNGGWSAWRTGLQDRHASGLSASHPPDRISCYGWSHGAIQGPVLSESLHAIKTSQMWIQDVSTCWTEGVPVWFWCLPGCWKSDILNTELLHTPHFYTSCTPKMHTKLYKQINITLIFQWAPDNHGLKNYL